MKFATALAVLLCTTTLAMANDFTFTMSATKAITGVRTIEQAGFRNDLDVAMTGSIHTLAIKQDGNDNDVNITSAGSQSTSAAESSSILQITGNGNVVNSTLTSAAGSLAPATLSSEEVITGNGNTVTHDIAADSISVDVEMVLADHLGIPADGNILTSTLTAPTVDLSMLVYGESNTLTQSASASALLRLYHSFGGSRNTVNVVAAAFGLSTLDVFNGIDGDDNTVNLNVAQAASSAGLNSYMVGYNNIVTVNQFGDDSSLILDTWSVNNSVVTITQSGAFSVAGVNINESSNIEYTMVQNSIYSSVDDTVSLALGVSSSITVTD